MKKVIFTFIIATMSTMVIASGNPVSSKVLFTSKDFNMSVVKVEQKAFFKHAGFDQQKDALEFVTKDKIAYLQIFKGSELQYQLPVMSNKLKIGRAIFDQGEYRLGFITTEGSTIQFTHLEVL